MQRWGGCVFALLPGSSQSSPVAFSYGGMSRKVTTDTEEEEINNDRGGKLAFGDPRWLLMG